MFYLIY